MTVEELRRAADAKQKRAIAKFAQAEKQRNRGRKLRQFQAGITWLVQARADALMADYMAEAKHITSNSVSVRARRAILTAAQADVGRKLGPKIDEVAAYCGMDTQGKSGLLARHLPGYTANA